MNDTIHMLSETVANLKKEKVSKDAQIKDLQDEVNLMQTRIEDLEQHGGKDSIRIFGLSECTPGSTTKKFCDYAMTACSSSPLSLWMKSPYLIVWVTPKNQLMILKTRPLTPKTSVGEVLYPKIEEPGDGYQEAHEAHIAIGNWGGGVR